VDSAALEKVNDAAENAQPGLSIADIYKQSYKGSFISMLSEIAKNWIKWYI